MAQLKKVATENAPAAIGPYSQAMICGDLVFTSGQIAIDPATGNVEAITIEDQTEQVMKNLGEVLKAAGSSFENAVKTTCFLADMGDFATFNGIYGQYFTTKPARSCVAVKTLPKNVLVEVEVIAMVNSAPTPIKKGKSLMA
ncbi:MAG: RidA family protein [Clostridia bacterium]|nr:RidA family protein [Clostridia bacterium]